MIVMRFFDPTLAQTSYLMACGQAGVAVVIDPNRDIAQYVAAAEAEGVRITHVSETHIHADFVSGARDLARRTGATLHLSDEGGPDWKYAYAEGDGAVLVRDGDSFKVGNVRLEVVHTPGHTPEHIAFLVTDTAVADKPIGMVTGDFVFVGDVGRPDLLERAASVAGTMEEAARALFRSLQKFKRYPDWLQVWPGHGAGSACGKGLSAVPHSTVGYERRFNWAFAIDDEDAFVRSVLEGQPEPPRYFAQMKRINKEGPTPYDPSRRAPTLSLDGLRRALTDGASVIDTRSAEQFAARHIRGTVNIPLNRSFNTWAGWLLPYDRDSYLIADGTDATSAAVRELALVALDRVGGVGAAALIDEWERAGGAIESIAQMDANELSRRIAAGTVAVLDVRGRSEWDAGHIPGAPNIPVGYLTDRLGELPAAPTLVLQCQAGGRSSIAASLLQAAGITNVANLQGGFEEWEARGLPVERANGATAPVG